MYLAQSPEPLGRIPGAGIARKVGRGIKAVGAKAVEITIRPLRNIVNRITRRRAAKLAWDRRRSKTPTPMEVREARFWTKQKFRAKGPHGKLIAHLADAGTDGVLLGTATGHLGQDPATLTAIAAVVGSLTALAAAMAKALEKSGEAPADPTAAAREAVAPGAEAAAEAYRETGKRIEETVEAGSKAVEAARAAAAAAEAVRRAAAGETTPEETAGAAMALLRGFGRAEGLTTGEVVLLGRSLGVVATPGRTAAYGILIGAGLLALGAGVYMAVRA